MDNQQSVEQYRPLLLSLAYRLIGSASESEDLVQETYVEYLLEATEAPDETPPTSASLSAILTRLCLDYLASDQVRQQHYEGPWLPEPVLTEGDALPPLDTPVQRASISLPSLVLLDTLEPEERAAYLLRDVFGYGDGDAARMLDSDVTDYRHIYERAVAHIEVGRPHFEYAPEAQRRVIERVVLATHGDDLDDLKELLAPDVTAWTDGGGQVAAASRPVKGRDAVARYLSGFMRKAATTLTTTYAEVNSAPALVSSHEGALAHVIAFDVADDTVRGVYLLLNPDKLAFIERQLREAR